MIPHLEAKDVVALCLIAALVTFKLTDHNGSLDVAVAVILGYYFGARYDGRDRGK